MIQFIADFDQAAGQRTLGQNAVSADRQAAGYKLNKT